MGTLYCICTDEVCGHIPGEQCGKPINSKHAKLHLSGEAGRQPGVYICDECYQRYRVEVFDCPERGFQDLPTRETADRHRDWLIQSGVEGCNIRIVKINADGAAI
jgi:hypothetical protein